MFNSDDGNMYPMLNCINPIITYAQNLIINRRVTYQEVKNALFDMKAEKSPGPDGLNLGFYQHFWDIIGNDLLNICFKFFLTGKLPSNLNATHTILIPKK